MSDLERDVSRRPPGGIEFERNRGVSHLTVRDSVSHIGVPVGDPATDMAEVFEVVATAGVNAYLIKIHEGLEAVAVDRADLDAAVQALTNGGYDVRAEQECSVVSTVARSMRDMSGVMSRIMGSLMSAQVDVRELADSYNSVSCLVRRSHRDKAVAALAGEFGVRLHDPTPEDPW